MAPLSRPAILSLTALTLHFSILSIVLHISRTRPGRRYHASSAIFLTELGKILVSFFLVLFTGELRTAVRERRKLREIIRAREEEEEEEGREQERQRKGREEEEIWMKEMGATVLQNGNGSARRESNGSVAEKDGLLPSSRPLEEEGWTDATVVPMTTVHRRTSSLAGEPATLSPSSAPKSLPSSSRARSNTLTINVPLANKPASARSPSPSKHRPGAPSLAIIPATPVPDPSPVRFPDPSGLYPERPLDRLAEHESTILEDLGSLEWWKCLWATVWGEGVWKLAVLAALFCFQGNAQYVASGNLSVPLFQLAYQLKIPATAMCSVILLNKALSRQQWASLFVLTFGVGLVQLFSVTSNASSETPPSAPNSASPSSTLDSLSAHSDAPPNPALGLTAVVAACMSSGFASVYFERILKVPSFSSSASSSASSSPDLSISSSPHLSPGLPSTVNSPPLPDPSKIVPSGKPSLWIRNIQLSIFGIVVGLPVVLWEMRGCLGALDYGYLDSSAEQGVEAAMGWFERAREAALAAGGNFFDGFNGVTWLVVALQIMGGLLSALVMQYADNLLKCFATSLSILLSVAASVVLFNFHVTVGIFLGACLVLGATFAYTSPAKDWRWRPSSVAAYSALPQTLGTR
ncbi:hypothetical protein JCM8547_007296 [Rhodosporidiobolus lusitaniae]